MDRYTVKEGECFRIDEDNAPDFNFMIFVRDGAAIIFAGDDQIVTLLKNQGSVMIEENANLTVKIAFHECSLAYTEVTCGQFGIGMPVETIPAWFEDPLIGKK